MICMKKMINSKMTMPQNVRLFLCIAVTVTLAVLLVTLGLKLSASNVVKEEVPRYQYHHKGDIQYQVKVRDNLLYKDNVLGMGMVYPTAYAEQLLAKVVYQYNGDKPGELTGQYRVTATIEGVQQEEKAEKILWSKEYSLVPETAFQSAEGQLQLEKELVIPFSTYNNFALQVQEDSGIISSVRLRVDWQINTQVQTEHGVVQEELSPGFTLPLCNRYFEVGGSLSQEKEGALTETVTKTVPVNKTVVMGLQGGALLCLLLLLGLWLFTKGARPDEYTRLVQQIFKKYAERLVALEQELPLGPAGSVGKEMFIRVKSIEDLVLVADEISRPVYYLKRGLAGEKGFTFYVISDTKVVSYEIKPTEYSQAKQIKKKGSVTESI